MNLPTPPQTFSPAASADLERMLSPERQLGLRGAQGDARATAELLKTLAPKITRIVRAVLGASHPDIDDATQLALVGFVQALPAYRGDADPLGYARVIAVRSAIATRKKRRLEQSRSEESEDIEDTRPDPGATVESTQRKTLLRNLLEELPPEQAETLALRVVLGCSLEEIALQTRVPLNTVRSRVRLAKERLRARIEADPKLEDLFGF